MKMLTLTLGLALQCKEAVPGLGACGDQQTHSSMVIMRTRGRKPWRKSSLFFFPAGGRVQLGGLGGRGSDPAVEIRAVLGASRVPVGWDNAP